jgi:hypothetical protein
MKHFIITLMFAGLIMPPAFALSCMAPNIFRSAQFLHEQDEEFILFKGSVTLKEAFKGPGYDDNPKPKKTTGQAEGVNLLTGTPFKESVTIQQRCYGPWCGSSSSKAFHNRLIYLHKKGDDYSIDLNPCGGVIFSEVSTEEEANLIQCIKEQNCEKPPIQ